MCEFSLEEEAPADVETCIDNMNTTLFKIRFVRLAHTACCQRKYDVSVRGSLTGRTGSTASGWARQWRLLLLFSTANMCITMRLRRHNPAFYFTTWDSECTAAGPSTDPWYLNIESCLGPWRNRDVQQKQAVLPHFVFPSRRRRGIRYADKIRVCCI
jgi:hypothetical protein